ncbi:MAG TPA: hypothetical protein VF017_19155 [Thermoanaerobaculia bacterium]|nr:hypothetical protein [Thermoanaerobaculia bacterium]
MLLPLALALSSLPALAAVPPCRPCAGVSVADATTAAALLGELPAISPDGRLYLAWGHHLSASDPTAAAAQAAAVAEAGATPWLRLIFHAAAPIQQHLGELEAELKAAAAVVRAASRCSHFQIVWQPAVAPAEGPSALDVAFLIKRAASAISGAQPQARVVSQPLPGDRAALEALYGEEIAAYLDGVSLANAPEAALAESLAALTELDPGRPVVIEGIPFPAEPTEALALAADAARLGGSIAFFDLPSPNQAALAPLVLLANEFHGDLSYDAGSAPEGAAGAWAFVRGEDLGLRLLVRSPPGAKEVTLAFSDPQLKKPEAVDPRTGKLAAGRANARAGGGLAITLVFPAPVTFLRFERASAAELEGGVAEAVAVSSEREMPVEEILRRLQAFEDGQSRKIDHYQAVNTTHLRFAAGGAGTGAFEATLQGDFFFRRGSGFDWAWQSLFINGVKWRSKTLPEIPLIQPEKAAAMPLEIQLSKRYSYRLRGSETIDGRDCWVVEFRPVADAVAEAEKLFRGTVWVDKAIYARVQTRAVQLGLEGEVLSNEETVSFRPLTADGQAAPWSPESYFLPVSTVAQQILSVINTTTVVERQIDLSAILINGSDFETRREQVLASEVTMVRDTARGLRYLVKQEGSEERVVREGYDTGKLFLLGGTFYDDSLDYPLPLLGINYFSFDVKGTGNQLNFFFGGALATVDFAQPRFLGSKFDVGLDAFVFAFPRSDELFRDDVEAPAEEVESTTGNVSVLIGHPIGEFVKVGLEYEATYDKFQEADDTDPAFILPEDTITHSLKLDARWARSGYQLALTGSWNKRQDWAFWGLPGNTDFEEDQDTYALWQASVSKTWYLPKFRRFSAALDYAGGSNLDRFSKYGFDFFGGTGIQGYQSGRVRAEEVLIGRLRYGVAVGESFRLEGAVDTGLANDDATGLDNEVLAGVGVNGQFIGPWNTVVQLSVGAPVAGPDDGFVAYLVFLKLFK